MQKDDFKPAVLFIASNIPTPKRNSNKVVMTIGHKVSKWFDISVMHPAEFAPFPINQMKKYKTIASGQSWVDDGIPVTPFKYIRLFGKKNAFALLPFYEKSIKKHLRQTGIPALVHAHFALPDGYIAYQIHKTYDIPYIISFRNSDVKMLQQSNKNNTTRMMKEALSNAQLIIVHNRTQQETLANMGYQSILMAHGVEEHFIKPKETTNHSNHLQVTTIGQLIPQKNIDWVVKAVESYQGQKKIVLRIAGEGPLRKELETLASGNNNIQFLGQISHENIGKLLHQSDIFALPSVNETFGLVYLEAAAHQNAIIASKGTGVWGHYTEEEEMFFCDSYDVFQTQLHKLIDDDALRNKMAEKAFAKTKENFTWDTIIEKYASLYRRLLTKPHSLSNKSFTG